MTVVLVLSTVGCTSSGDAPSRPAPDRGAESRPIQSVGHDPPGSAEALPTNDPVARAEAFLTDIPLGLQEGQISPESVAILDYVARRWSRPRLLDPEVALAALATSPFYGFARLYDPSVRLDAEEAATFAADLGSALYCDQHALPDGYGDALQRWTDEGGYFATHVLLAIRWVDELGCTLGGRDLLLAAAVDRVADELDQASEVTDLSVQQIAFLDLVGAMHRVDPTWEDRLTSSQMDDGGWPEDLSAAGRWHTAGPAWWALLAFREPGDTTTRMVP